MATKTTKGGGRGRGGRRRRSGSTAPEAPPAPVGSRTLAEEVESAFLEYSMSVIVSRALPDVRDGLKPVHRRILWSMDQAGMRPDRPHVKCARVVGDVMGRYHPHGDAAIYEALVRMGQDFSLPVPLVDKHGNFGAPADPPAAARYTECRLSEAAGALLDGIDEGTVDRVGNYDGTAQEPEVLPARFPNLLVNGAQGIAVGLATNVPPHALGEVVGAALRLLDKPEATTSELMRHVKGPDFPTGGLVMGDEGIKEAYRTGRGTIRLRAVTEVVEHRRGASIVVSEVPYQTSVEAIAGKLAEAVEAGRVDGVRDIRNESAQGATRLVVELRPEADPEIVRNNLFKHTPAQTTFGINMVALVDGVPRTLTLVEILRHWLTHQEEVITRRSRFRLERAEARLHLVEGLLAAIDRIDEIIALIRASEDRAEARAGLTGDGFGFSERQADHILDMPLGRLTRLGRQELDAEAAQLRETIAALRRILAERDALLAVIRDELTEIRDRFATPRRTRIVTDDTGEIDADALVADEPLVVTVTARGALKATPARAKGRKVATAGDKDAVAGVIETTARRSLVVCTDRGVAYRILGRDLPKSRVTPISSLVQTGDGEAVVAVLDDRLVDEHDHLVFVTARGTVKRSALADLVDVSTRRDGVTAMKLTGDDRVVAVFPAWGAETLLVTAGGQAIRFPEDDIRVVGRSAGGSRGIRLRGDDRVVGAAAVADGEVVVLATAAGHAKRVRVEDFPVQARGGAGVKAAKLEAKRGALAGLAPLGDRMAFVSAAGAVVVADTAIRLAGREATGSLVPGYPGGELVRVAPVPAGADA